MRFGNGALTLSVMSLMKKNIAYLLITLFACTAIHAQGDSFVVPQTYNPEFKRSLNHDNIDKEQLILFKSDGKADKFFYPVQSDEINFMINAAATQTIDWLQYKIETDTLIDHRLKVKYLKGLENTVHSFTINYKAGKVQAAHLPDVLKLYEQCYRNDEKGLPIDGLVNAQPYDVGLCVIEPNIIVFGDNASYKASQYALFRKYCEVYPSNVFLRLKENSDYPFLDSLILATGYKYPGQLYDYAAAYNKLGIAIRKIDDPLVKAVSQMATSSNGRWYFPFLDNIVKGKISIADIDAVKDDSVKYYQLLVNTHIDYVDRIINSRDTAYGYRELEERMKKKALDVFVTTINGLHEVDDPAVRFKVIQPLRAEDLYYLAVLTDGEIYTSSFVKGVYPLMLSRMNNRADSLLMLVRFDKYRKLIKMAAGYNTLNLFLAAFPDQKDAEKLIQAFTGSLEKSNNLEDGVDVADSYASIVEQNKPLADQMLANIQANYQRNVQQNNKRGIVMYNLLDKLFLSADTTKDIDLSKEFGIPPVYNLPYNSLTDNGSVIAQVFFYGDKDGQSIFPGFVDIFNNANWKIDRSNKQWVCIKSVKGKPVSIYANVPLPEESGEDERAQKALDSFLLKNNLKPSVVIHRGHSYFAPYTIDQIQPSSKIVFMGSCGGYHLIHDILGKAPDAHIIASKQIGKTAVNKPFFVLLSEKLRTGSSIDWIPFWKELEETLRKQNRLEGFEDYIPPYKNLGAIFIKAYKTAMGDEN